MTTADPSDRMRPIRMIAGERLGMPGLHVNGFFPVLKSELIRPARPAVFIQENEQVGDLQIVHTASGWIEGAGLTFLREGQVAGHGFVLFDGRLLLSIDPHSVVPYFARQEGLDDQGLLHGKTPIEANRPLLTIIGPGYGIWGHWLIDFLPRIALAQKVLGHDLGDFIIPIPADAPIWTRGLLRYFCGVTDEHLLVYDRLTDYVSGRAGLCVPDDLHTSYNLHSALGDFYKGFMPTVRSPTAPQRICVSRSRFAESRSVQRTFPCRARFEALAVERGFDLVHPENLSIREQIATFAGATAVVGEFGSGMHNTLFSPPECVVGQFVMPSPIQSRIAGLRDHRSVFLLPDNAPRFDASEPAMMETSEDAMRTFFDAVLDQEAEAKAELALR